MKDKTMRTRTTNLHTCIEDFGSPFDFDYPMPAEMKPIFEELFIDTYFYRDINFDTYNMFKHQLKAKLRLLMPKYLQLYTSENLITNPFVNMMLESDQWNRERERLKQYEVKRGINHNEDYGQNAGIKQGVSGGSSGSHEANITASRGRNKHKSLGNSFSVDDAFFADSPQVQQTDEQMHVFNDGYLTTKNRDENITGNIASQTDFNTNKVSSETGTDAYSNNKSYEDNVDESLKVGNGSSYNDSENVEASEATNKIVAQKYGLDHVTVSKIVLEWRTTFLNTNQMLIDELRPLFMYIY